MNFDTLVSLAKQTKLAYVQKTDRGDVPPTVMVERDGKVQAIIVAPQVDKHLGLHAARLGHAGYNADALTLFFDAHMASAPMPAKDATEAELEAAKEDFAKKWPAGSMQKACDEEGACARGEIVDILLCHRIDKAGKISMFMLPYSYHGKDGGVPFKWLDDHEVAKAKQDESDWLKLEGNIPDTLREIMSSPSVIDMPQFEPVRKAAEEIAGFTPERRNYHIARAMLSILKKQGFQVTDLQDLPEGVTEERPLIGDEEDDMKSVSIFDVIPEQARSGLVELMERIHETAGTPEFTAKVREYLETHKSEIDKNAEKMDIDVDLDYLVFVLEQVLSKAPKAKRQKPPYRVKVHDGTGNNLLGYGDYVGDVPVWFVVMPDGSLCSRANAEEKPDESEVPVGAEVVSAGDNPKIVLDNGQIVYGCQVWWNPVDEHEHGENCGCGSH